MPNMNVLVLSYHRHDMAEISPMWRQTISFPYHPIVHCVHVLYLEIFRLERREQKVVGQILAWLGLQSLKGCQETTQYHWNR